MEPKISVNKLGEYMTASPSRRKQILRDQKNPSAFKVARYKAARDSIVSFMQEGMENDASLLARAQELRSDCSGSDFLVQDRLLSANAIEDFQPLAEEIEIVNLTVESGSNFQAESLLFGGTRVSIRPDAIIKNSSGKIVGGVKFNFSKSAPLLVKESEYVATALRVYLEENSDRPKMIDPASCYVVDVPTGSVITAPKSNKKRLGDLAAAGEEIYNRWESI